jgi:hypothetical protein
MYRVTDRLQAEHSVEVSGHDLTATVSTWLAELGAHTAPVDDLARAICAGDWPTAYAISDRLSVDVSVAAPAAASRPCDESRQWSRDLDRG